MVPSSSPSPEYFSRHLVDALIQPARPGLGRNDPENPPILIHGFPRVVDAYQLGR